jgi:DNA-binding transcriptional MerR regulator
VPGVSLNSPKVARLLSIGEFAAATQLSPKALRLYDEQGLLQPAKIDPASGYRYYGNDQVSTGRLIRTLRDMDLALADVARVVEAGRAQAEVLLSRFAVERDHRYAREKHAFQSALLHLRDASRADAVTVEQRTRAATTVLVSAFTADRPGFYERLHKQTDSAREIARKAGLQLLQETYCRLAEPLSEEESQLELLLPVETPTHLPEAVTLRQLPAAECAVIALAALNVQGADFSAPVDALFDWFDRGGYRAIDAPCLTRLARGAELHSEICWAYESASTPTR